MSEIIAVTYPTALEFWLDVTDRESTDKYAFQNRKLADLPYWFKMPDLKFAARELSLDLGFSFPISFTVPHRGGRVKRATYKKYARSEILPNASFVEMDTRLYPKLSGYKVLIASPEYCFLCAAKEYSFCELVEIGFNLCAIYVKDQNSSFGQSDRIPLITSQQLKSYILSAKGMNNYQKALRAANFVQDNSRSPMESKLGTIICIPKSKGGYGMTPPLMNHDIYHSSTGKKLLNREKSNCDMVWVKEKVILEYDSDLAHGNIKQFSYDKVKYRSLVLSDYKVFPIVRQDLLSLDRMDELFMEVKKQLKGKTEKTALQKYRLEREDVYQKLFKAKK